MKITAVVVTYNRKDMLVECIDAILGQSYPVDEVVVLDNASTDGTRQLLEEKSLLQDRRVVYVRKEENTGGAGGFYYGSKRAYEDDADWIWMMDDDCFPTETALEELVNATKIVDASFLCSAVYTPDGGMNNSPGIDARHLFWYEYLSEELIQITSATFVSFFVARGAVEKCGLPYRQFFIWCDDTEYSYRLVRGYKPAYFVGKSKVIHRIAEKGNPQIKWLDLNRIRLVHYQIRNSLIFEKEYGTFSSWFQFRYMYTKMFFAFLFKGKPYRFTKAMQVVKGFFEFWMGTYDRKAFKNRYRNHLE